MTADPLALTHELDRADARLLTTVATLTDASLAAPSLLPGWTRGHVLAHIAGNADSLNNLLTWARTGVVTPAYPSVEARNAAIETGSSRPHAEAMDAVRGACARFAEAAAAMPADRWAYVLDDKLGPAARIVWRRLREVEVHHVDLDAGYAPSDWPDAFTQRLLNELVTTRPRSTDTSPPVRLQATELSQPMHLGDGTPTTTVHGSGADLAAWLSGRSTGTGLTVEPAGPLPTLSDWM